MCGTLLRASATYCVGITECSPEVMIYRVARSVKIENWFIAKPSKRARKNSATILAEQYDIRGPFINFFTCIKSSFLTKLSEGVQIIEDQLYFVD